jgi:hypothetical protein
MGIPLFCQTKHRVILLTSLLLASLLLAACGENSPSMGTISEFPIPTDKGGLSNIAISTLLKSPLKPND